MGSIELFVATHPVTGSLPVWGWVAIVVVGLIGMAAIGVIRRRQAKANPDQPERREGIWSLLYYVFVDWWLS
jgi:hypothetical protein